MIFYYNKYCFIDLIIEIRVILSHMSFHKPSHPNAMFFFLITGYNKCMASQLHLFVYIPLLAILCRSFSMCSMCIEL